jgi:hypothetical protein
MALKDEIEFGKARQELTALADGGIIVDQGEDLLKVELACGTRKKEGFKGMDRVAIEGVDIVHDLFSFPWPLKDESVYEFNTEHFFEHIPHHIAGCNMDGLFAVMEEVYRCLMPEGTIRVVTPYYASKEAVQDPTHCREICEVTYDYFNQNVTKAMGIGHYMPKCNFEKLYQKRIANPEWEGKADTAIRWAGDHYLNVYREIEVMLRKKPLLE